MAGCYGPLTTNKPGLVVEIEKARATTNVLVAKLKGVSDRTTAEQLNGGGSSMWIATSCRRRPEDDDFYSRRSDRSCSRPPRRRHGIGQGHLRHPQFLGAGDLSRGTRPTRTGDTLYLYPFTKAVVVPEIHVAEGLLLIEVPVEADPGEEEPD